MKRAFFILFSMLCVLCACAGGAYADEITDDLESRQRGIEIVTPGVVIPAMPLLGLKIGIDPGHQAKGNSQQETVSPDSNETKAKVSSGTRGVASGVAEYIVNLDVAYMLRDMLTQMGAEVLMTRETHDIDISNQQRAIMMNEWGADAVLRIHCNGATDSNARGMGMYIRKTGACAEESYDLADCLAEAMKKTTGAKCNGLYRRDSYTGLNWSNVPSVLVEMGYMSNREDDLLLNDPEYQSLLVIGMVNGLIDYFSGDMHTRD